MIKFNSFHFYLVKFNLPPSSTISQNARQIQNKSILPEIKENITKSQNPFYFYLRFSKPLKLVEPKIKFIDPILLLTKVQRARRKYLKEEVKKIQKEKLKGYSEMTRNKIEYKNMLPIKVWRDCEKTYEKIKPKYKKMIKLKEEKHKLNINSRSNIKNGDIFIDGMKLGKIGSNKNGETFRKNINLSMENIKIKNNKFIKERIFNEMNKSNNNNFERCISTINIKHKFENQGLNQFIKNINKQFF